MKDVIEESKQPAGAGGFLGALVRALQAAHADPGKGGEVGQGQGQARQDGHRQESGNSRPDGHPVDPGGDRLLQRPAGRRFHGRAAREPGHGVPRARDQGQDRRRGKRPDESRRRGACRRQCRRGRQSLRAIAHTGRRQCRGACRARALLRADRRARAGQADARAWCPKPSATTRRSPPRAPRSRSPSRPSRSARSTNWKRKSRPIRSTIRRASISPPRSTPRASARKPPIICSRSSSATANGTTTRARKQLVQFFEAWGPTDAATVEGRKRLSSILFS